MLQFDRVSREFVTPDGAAYCALRDITFEIRDGAFVAIVGPSGCGKSTLLHIAAGLLAPSSGTVRVGGDELAGLNTRATYMFQQDALLPWKNVRDNVALGLTFRGIARAEALSQADGWLTRVGLASFASHYPSQLSGGMRKRVAMAQNWILDRSQLLMDEPFGALDVHTRVRMETELLTLWEGTEHDQEETAEPAKDAKKQPLSAISAFSAVSSSRGQRKTVLFVTHDLEEAIALADEVVILSAGPATRVVAVHPVPLERPRDLFELRTAPAFVDLYRSIWAELRDEVIKSQR